MVDHQTCRLALGVGLGLRIGLRLHLHEMFTHLPSWAHNRVRVRVSAPSDSGANEVG